MKSSYIIGISILFIINIILIVICVLLYLSKQKSEICLLDKETRLRFLYNDIFMNTNNYNEMYNMNFTTRNIKMDEILNMESTMATVMIEPFKKTIFVDDKELVIYITRIKYDIKNYMKNDPTKPFGTIAAYGSKSSIKLAKENNTNIGYISTGADIVTTKEVHKNDTFLVYYKYGNEDNARIAPPFLSDTYVTYFS
jgi:hypothetical protein